jgi:hypothetical protein
LRLHGLNGAEKPVGVLCPRSPGSHDHVVA